MKVPSYKFEKSISESIENSSYSSLIYGPNIGMVDELSHKVQNLEKFKSFKRIKLNSEEIEKDSSKLLNEVLNLDLFSPEKLIIINNASDKITPIIKEIKENPNEKESLFILTIGHDLESTSKLRLLYEKDDNFACIPCYQDEEDGVKTIIQDFFNQHKIEYSRRAIEDVSSNFKGDRRELKNTLEVAHLYLGEKKKITDEEIELIFLDSKEIVSFEMADKIGEKNTKDAFYYYTKLSTAEVSVQQIIRTIINHFLLLKKLKQQISNEKSKSEVLKENRVFFKRLHSFQKQMDLWTEKAIDKALIKLLKCELLTKMHSSNSEVVSAIMSKNIISICKTS